MAGREGSLPSSQAGMRPPSGSGGGFRGRDGCRGGGRGGEVVTTKAFPPKFFNCLILIEASRERRSNHKHLSIGFIIKIRDSTKGMSSRSSRTKDTLLKYPDILAEN
ncbi:unnamed protein product [Musa banksii]